MTPPPRTTPRRTPSVAGEEVTTVMWCKSCGAPLAVTAQTCGACQHPHQWGETPVQGGAREAHVRTAVTGEPCSAGRSMGGLRIRETCVTEPLAGETPGGLPATGEQRLFEVRCPGDIRVWMAFVEWSDGEMEVRRTRRHEVPWWLDMRLGREHLAVEAWGTDHLCVELRQARLDDDEHSRTYPADEYTLDVGCHACVRCALLSVGATAMGTRQEILGVSDDRRHLLCVAFPRTAQKVAIAAFALTRISPVINRIRSRSA